MNRLTKAVFFFLNEALFMEDFQRVKTLVNIQNIYRINISMRMRNQQ